MSSFQTMSSNLRCFNYKTCIRARSSIGNNYLDNNTSAFTCRSRIIRQKCTLLLGKSRQFCGVQHASNGMLSQIIHNWQLQQQHRCQSSSTGSNTGKRQNWKQQQKQSNLQRPTTAPNFIKDARIQSKPPNEKILVDDSKFPLPDKVKEKELTQLQIEIQDLHKAGNYSRALPLSETLVKETIAHFGTNHPATGAAYNNLGLMRKLQGQFDEARADYVTAQNIYRAIVGSDHSSYANTLHNLGNLNRTQIHLDTTLSATDRLSLVESALRYLEEAYTIRLAEFGPVHPLTVSSRSSWGTTLAAQILHHHKMTSALEKGGDLMRKRFYVSILPTDVTETAWNAAEEHLREALTTAIENPRGLTISKVMETKTNSGPPQRGKRKIQKVVPKKDDTSTKEKIPQTLSAASAAQNLAVFLKSRATTVQPYEMKWLLEAEKLYRQVLHVQGILLPQGNGTTITTSPVNNVKVHPDMYATKHSLAEVLEAMGQEDAAKQIRQDILDTFDPPSTTTTTASNDVVQLEDDNINDSTAEESFSSSTVDAANHSNNDDQNSDTIDKDFISSSTVAATTSIP